MISREKLRKPHQHPDLVIKHIEKIISLDKDVKFKTAEQLARNNTATDLWSERKDRKIKKLEQQAIIDPMTGLYNKGFLDGNKEEKRIGMLETIFKNAQRGGNPLSAVMIDVDAFKEINNKKGHIIGDEVLKRIANAIKTNIRDSDFAFRNGGDEILLLLPSTDMKGAINLVKKLRKTINELTLDQKELSKALTISSGIAMFMPLKDGDPLLVLGQEELKKAADDAETAAKNYGRNQIFIATKDSTGDYNYQRANVEISTLGKSRS